MKTYHTYRFPPLGALDRHHARASNGLDDADARADAAPGYPDAQAAIQAGFQQGMASGYQAGFEEGERHGQAAGHDAGRAEGLRRGASESRLEVRAEFDGVADMLDTLLRALNDVAQTHRDAVREALLDMVPAVARQVIRCELTLHPGQWLALIDETLSAMPATTAAPEIYLHPEECARLAALLPERASHWNLIADAHLMPGECRVTAGGHEADAGCEYRLAACMQQVSQRLSAGAEETSSERSRDDAAEHPDTPADRMTADNAMEGSP